MFVMEGERPFGAISLLLMQQTRKIEKPVSRTGWLQMTLLNVSCRKQNNDIVIMAFVGLRTSADNQSVPLHMQNDLAMTNNFHTNIIFTFCVCTHCRGNSAYHFLQLSELEKNKKGSVMITDGCFFLSFCLLTQCPGSWHCVSASWLMPISSLDNPLWMYWTSCITVPGRDCSWPFVHAHQGLDVTRYLWNLE